MASGDGIQSFVQFKERDVSAQNDAQNRRCIIRWSPTIDAFSTSGFVLLRHIGEDGGLEVIDVDHSGLIPLPETDAIVVDGHNQSLWELAPGGHVSFAADPPERYYRALRAGDTYMLLYPGSTRTMWEWGGIRDRIGTEMKREEAPTPDRALVIPGGAHVTFTVREETPA